MVNSIATASSANEMVSLRGRYAATRRKGTAKFAYARRISLTIIVSNANNVLFQPIASSNVLRYNERGKKELNFPRGTCEFRSIVDRYGEREATFEFHYWSKGK